MGIVHFGGGTDAGGEDQCRRQCVWWNKGGGIGAHGLLHVGVFIVTGGGQMRWVLT